MALDKTSDFLVIDRDGLGINLEEKQYETPYVVAVP
jgi:ureidoglycolate lyase